jgi:hypothetical protein
MWAMFPDVLVTEPERTVAPRTDEKSGKCSGTLAASIESKPQ